VDLRAPLDRVIDPARVTKALERARLILHGRAAGEEAARRHMSTMLREFYDVHGDVTDELFRGQQRAHGLDTAGPSQVQWSPSTSLGFVPQAATPEDAVSSRSVGQEGHI
jgi:hypothetical protein